jgi:hypothetical protein
VHIVHTRLLFFWASVHRSDEAVFCHGINS